MRFRWRRPTKKGWIQIKAIAIGTNVVFSVFIRIFVTECKKKGFPYLSHWLEIYGNDKKHLLIDKEIHFFLLDPFPNDKCHGWLVHFHIIHWERPVLKANDKKKKPTPVFSLQMLKVLIHLHLNIVYFICKRYKFLLFIRIVSLQMEREPVIIQWLLPLLPQPGLVPIIR